MKQRVAIGLSGGVDSSVAATLLIEQGYEVAGVYITCWSGAGCRDEEDKKDALDVALQLGIPFVHLDFQQEYKEKVYEYMMSEYQAGRTPNPDVMCNREIKFGLFYDWALQQGYDFVATGHYAQIKESVKSGVLSQKSVDLSLKTYHLGLFKSVDEKKDQTYFLWQLKQEQLAHILFPIGHLSKEEVRREAEKRRLLTAKKPDSQGICFIGEIGINSFLSQKIEQKEGQLILNTPGVLNLEVGKHRGVWFYTIGQKIAIDQRKIVGFDKTNLPHFYVVRKDVEKNIIYVGTKGELYTDEIRVGQIHWITEKKIKSVRIRHGGELVPICRITTSLPDYLKIELTKPVWGVAPGQSIVFYGQNECLGGGIVEI